MKDFCLSDKVRHWAVGGELTSSWYPEEDVKEAIRLLKIEMYLTWENAQVINKIFGDELTKVGEE